MNYQMVLRLALAVLLCVAPSACNKMKGASPLDELARQTADDAVYTVAPGDTLKIEVWGEPRLTGEVLVRQDGRFTMSLIGDVDAEGKDLDAVAADVTARLAEFVPGASVAVGVVQSAPIRYYLSGTFMKPGEYRSEGRISLLQAIATGGGFAPFADTSNLLLIRKTAKGEKRYQFHYEDVVEGSQPNPLLKDGDVIAIR